VFLAVWIVRKVLVSAECRAGGADLISDVDGVLNLLLRLQLDKGPSAKDTV
jgi:hypothetical protein